MPLAFSATASTFDVVLADLVGNEVRGLVDTVLQLVLVATDQVAELLLCIIEQSHGAILFCRERRACWSARHGNPVTASSTSSEAVAAGTLQNGPGAHQGEPGEQ